jgi:hypothetical protein
VAVGRGRVNGPLAEAFARLASELRWEDGRGLRLGSAWVSEPARALLALRDYLYQRYFCGWEPSAEPPRPWPGGTAAFVAELAAAAGGATCWEPGWRVMQAEGGQLYVSNGHVLLYLEERAGLRPSGAGEGEEVALRLPCSRPAAAPGFFWLHARTGPLSREAVHLKLYLNLAPEGAPGLVRALLTEEAWAPLRFDAKVFDTPGDYGRRDTGILYLEPTDLPRAAELLRALQARHPEHWREGTPLCTWPLARGLAVAESPREENEGLESFGQHRSRLLAQGVLRALASGERSPECFLRHAADVFSEHDLSLERPWLQTFPELPLAARP